MAEFFIDATVTTNEQDLADLAVEFLRTQWPDWDPDEGDLGVIQIEAMAHMASDAAKVASIMPAAAFEQIMLLFGVERSPGLPSSGTVTFTLLDDQPHVIPANTEVEIDGWVFRTDDDVSIAALEAAGVSVSSSEINADANGLTGDYVAMISALGFVESVSLDAPTGGGADPESDDAYLNKGSRALELQALTLVTARDYELMTLTNPAVGRVSVAANTEDREIVVTASTPDGLALDADTKDDLEALYDQYRQTSWTVVMSDPTVNEIDVDFTVHLYPGYEELGVLLEARFLVEDYLNTSRWPAPNYQRDPSVTFPVEPMVRKNKLIDIIGNAQGVDYVVDVTISSSSGAASGDDWLMAGSVPLPAPGVVTGATV